MDFLTKAFQPIRDVFLAMSVSARITAGLLLAAIVVGLAFLVTRTGVEAEEYLLSGQPFSETELAKMEAAFAKANLGGYKIVGNRVRIPPSQKAAYVAALVDGDALPPNPATFMDAATSNANPFESKQQREARLKFAREQQLSHVVSQMAGIANATVSFDEQEKGGFPRRVEKTAVAAVWSESNLGLTPKQVRSIRDYVAGSIAGLNRENVTVMDQVLGVSYAGAAEGSLIGMDDPYAARKQKYEEEWRQKILETLSMVPGVVVGVNVELDPELIHDRSSVEFDPKKTAAVMTKENRKTDTSTGPAPGGRPGAVPNGVTHNAGAAVTQVEAPKSESEESGSEQVNSVSRSEIRGSKAAFVPTVVKASIRVPQSYFAKIWRESHPPAPGQEPTPPTLAELQQVELDVKNSIEKAVVALMPEQEAGADPYIAVTFTTYQDLSVPEPAPPSLAAQATTWLGANWQTAGMVLLGLVSLVMLRGVARSLPAPAEPVAVSQGAPQPQRMAAAEDEEEEEETTAARLLARRFRVSGPNLKAELADMVREDPESAAKVLSTWIGEVN
jgi:flagellar M-ring protein FliF